MVRKTLRALGWTILSLLLVGFIAFNLLVVWVATGPRSLKEFVPKIEAQFNSNQSQITVKMEDVFLTWQDWKHPITSTFTNVHFYNHKKQELASFEELSAGLDLLSLLKGSIRPNYIELHKPIINIYRKIDGSFALDMGQVVSYGPELPKANPPNTAIQPLEYYIKQANIPELQSLSGLVIQGGTLNIGDTSRGIILTLSNANLAIDLSYTRAEVFLVASTKNGQEIAEMSLNANIPYKTLAATAKATLKNFKPSSIGKLHQDLKLLEGFNLPVTGWVDVGFDKAGKLTNADYKLTAGKGSIKTQWLEGDLNVSSAMIEGELTDKQLLRVDRGQLITEGVTADVRASIWKNAQQQIGIKLEGLTENVPVERVKLFWPPWQSPESREWVVSNLSKGIAKKASVLVNIKPGQLELPKLPNETVKAEITYEHMDVRYKPEHEKVINANGTVKLNANQLEVLIDKADYLTESKISNARFFIGDLMADNPRMELTLKASAPAADIATLLAYPDLALAVPLGISKDSLSGSATGEAALAFSYYAPRDANGNIIEDELVEYKINADLKDVSQKKFLGKYDIADANGKLYADNQKLTFAGESELFGDTLDVQATHFFAVKDSIETVLKIAGNISSATLGAININIEDFAKGSFASKADITQFENGDVKLSADVDAAAAELKVGDLHWNKAVGVPASIYLELNTKGKLVDISKLDVTSQDANVRGSLNLDEANQLVAFKAKDFKLGKTQLTSVEYAPIPGGFKLHASGAVLDLTGYMKEREDRKENFSFESTPALDLDFDVVQIVLAEGRVVENLKGNMQCNIRICPSASFKGAFGGGKPFTFDIKSDKNRRFVTATAEDAGSFLKGLDVYENMKQGRLNLDAVYDDFKAGSPMSGKLHIWDFQVQKTPVLARIITLASFGGLLDALQGNGITFDKFSTQFGVYRDVITVTDLKNVGSAIGLSADGAINLKTNSMKLKGTIVPSYTINSFLKDVPIVGEILTGGQGIIAAVYVMEGDIDAPEVSVNPLSILTPGFLRKMFE